MPEIRTFDELLVFMGQVVAGEQRIEDLTLATDTMLVEVHVEGESWDQRIDFRGARFVQSFQKQVDALYKRFATHLPGEPPTIKVQVQEGSNVLSPELIELARHAINIMGATGVTASVLFGIACAAGLAAYWRRQQSVDQAQMRDVALQSVESLRLVAMQNNINPIHAEKPFRDLAKSLGEEDTISVGGREPLGGAELRQLVSTRSPRTQSEAFPCDGTYLLKKIDLTAQPLILELSQGDHDIKALTELLPREAAQQLLDLVKEKQGREELPFEISLQMAVRVTGHQIKFGSILGIGDPRPGLVHRRLSQLGG